MMLITWEGIPSNGKKCLKSLAACRLEELALEHPEANLRAFDPRLAAAAKVLRGDARWSKSLAAGGSDAAALAAPLPAAKAEVRSWPLPSARNLPVHPQLNGAGASACTA